MLDINDIKKFLFSFIIFSSNLLCLEVTISFGVLNTFCVDPIKIAQGVSRK